MGLAAWGHPGRGVWLPSSLVGLGLKREQSWMEHKSRGFINGKTLGGERCGELCPQTAQKEDRSHMLALEGQPGKGGAEDPGTASPFPTICPLQSAIFPKLRGDRTTHSSKKEKIRSKFLASGRFF